MYIQEHRALQRASVRKEQANTNTKLQESLQISFRQLDHLQEMQARKSSPPAAVVLREHETEEKEQTDINRGLVGSDQDFKRVGQAGAEDIEGQEREDGITKGTVFM
jgi:hypothetical protein